MRKLAVVCLLFIIAFNVSSQEKPVITVLDFSVNNISINDMKSIISLFSSALFRTGKYTVIEINQRDEILKELKFSFSGSSDESYQLEIGKLLSAEQIVVGDIGSIGNRYILTSKILETETGRTLKTSDGIYKNLDALIDDIFSFTERLTSFETEAAAVEQTESLTLEEVTKEPQSAADNTVANQEVLSDTPEPGNAFTTNETKNTDPDPIPEPKKKSNVDIKKITAWTSLGIGAAATLAGGYLFYDAYKYYNGTVAPSYQAYLDASADFDTYWNTYTSYQDTLKDKAVVSSIVSGSGLLLVGLGITLFLLPEKVSENTAVAFIINPVDGGSTIALSYTY